MVEGAHTVAAIILETVVGTNGILVPPDGYLQGIRERCDRHGIVMICDEVMAGFGRCGEWFAFQKWGVQPDLVCFAKGVNSGYLPLGGVVISQTDRRHVPRPRLPRRPHLLGPSAGVRLGGGQHQHLQGGGHHRARPHARHRRDRARPGEAAGQPSERRRGARPRRVLGARSRHAIATTRQPLVPYNAAGADAKPMAELAAACKQRGLWPFTHFNRLHVVPPCTATVDEVTDGLGHPRRGPDRRRLVLHRLTRPPHVAQAGSHRRNPLRGPGGRGRHGNGVLQQARDRAPTRPARGGAHASQRTDHRHLQPHQLCRRCAAGAGVSPDGTIAATVGDLGCVRRAGARHGRSQARVSSRSNVAPRMRPHRSMKLRTPLPRARRSGSFPKAADTRSDDVAGASQDRSRALGAANRGTDRAGGDGRGAST